MNPTYHSLGNHTEAIEIDFAPDEITYQEVLSLIWKSHNPIGTRRSSQYKSAIWYASDRQKELIHDSMQPLIESYQCELSTDVLPLETFFAAEDYHQKYVLQRHDGIMKKFKTFYPTFSDFVDSTAAARLNGFAYGFGSDPLFQQEQNSYGFSPDELACVRK